MYQLAQINVAQMVAPLTEPVMADFVAQLHFTNKLADDSPGFIWRLQTSEGNATALHPYDDDLIIINLSLWASLADYAAFVYKGHHRSLLQQRRRWFRWLDGPHTALWWTPRDQIPSIEEAKQRLASLRTCGETPNAFSLKKSFPMPEKNDDLKIVN